LPSKNSTTGGAAAAGRSF